MHAVHPLVLRLRIGESGEEGKNTTSDFQSCKGRRTGAHKLMDYLDVKLKGVREI